MEKLSVALDLYFDTFEDNFPTFPMMGESDEKIIEIINKCVEAKKDVYDMGYLKLDVNIMY